MESDALNKAFNQAKVVKPVDLPVLSSAGEVSLDGTTAMPIGPTPPGPAVMMRGQDSKWYLFSTVEQSTDRETVIKRRYRGEDVVEDDSEYAASVLLARYLPNGKISLWLAGDRDPLHLYDISLEDVGRTKMIIDVENQAFYDPNWIFQFTGLTELSISGYVGALEGPVTNPFRRTAVWFAIEVLEDTVVTLNINATAAAGSGLAGGKFRWVIVNASDLYYYPRTYESEVNVSAGNPYASGFPPPPTNPSDSTSGSVTLSKGIWQIGAEATGDSFSLTSTPPSGTASATMSFSANKPIYPAIPFAYHSRTATKNFVGLMFTVTDSIINKSWAFTLNAPLKPISPLRYLYWSIEGTSLVKLESTDTPPDTTIDFEGNLEDWKRFLIEYVNLGNATYGDTCIFNYKENMIGILLAYGIQPPTTTNIYNNKIYEVEIPEETPPIYETFLTEDVATNLKITSYTSTADSCQLGQVSRKRVRIKNCSLPISDGPTQVITIAAYEIEK